MPIIEKDRAELFSQKLFLGLNNFLENFSIPEVLFDQGMVYRGQRHESAAMAA